MISLLLIYNILNMYTFQLMDIFGSLLDRPMIKEDFDRNYPRLVTLMDEEILCVKDIYDEHMKVYAFCSSLYLQQKII